MSAPYKTLLTIDAETRWDSKELTLSKMTTEAYIRDPRFKAFGFCIHEFGTSKPIQWYRHDELQRILKTYDWKTTAVLAQNCLFDASILSFIYGVEPCFMFDTLSMARALRGVEGGNSLAKLAEYYGLPPKGRAVHSTDGLEELTPEIEQELLTYCQHDVYLCEAIFAKLLARDETPYETPPKFAVPLPSERGNFPAKELRIIDMTLRMYTKPELVLDKAMLVISLDEEKEKLRAALERAGVDEDTLASNDHFAEVLRKLGCEPPTKPSPANKEKQIFAFAKNDALFQQLLNSDDEDVAILCEARLRVKSTSVRTRAQRFIDIANRGTLPIPLSYYGAGTGRFSASRGESINMQNLKRGSALRKAITAPDGYVICAGDLSQIEPRVLAWLSDYEEMLNIFRAGGDPYATFGGQMFGIEGMSKESHPLLRQSAKSALLGCLGGETSVLTSNGIKRITDVGLVDMLWDGIEWVRHDGVLFMGEKETWTKFGLTATSDHRILTESGWEEWGAVVNQSSYFRSALRSGSLPASDGSGTQTLQGRRGTSPECAVHAGGKDSWHETTSTGAPQKAAMHAGSEQRSHQLFMVREKPFLLQSVMLLESLRALAGRTITSAINRGCDVLVGGKGLFLGAIFSQGVAHAAGLVRGRRLPLSAGNQRGTLKSAQMRSTATAFLTASARSLYGALIRKAKYIRTMGGAASRCTQRGLKTVWSFFGISSPLMAGISPSFSLIGETMSAGMHRATFALSHAALTCQTSGKSLPEKSLRCESISPPLKQRMPTYDIAMAGPRNRYTVMTDAGPIIVHNCGYQLGWASFSAQLLVGFLGAPPVRYTKSDARQLGVTGSDVQKFLSWDENLKKMAEIPHTCTDVELAVHCLAAKAIIDKYRAAAAPVTGFWSLLGNLLERSLLGGEVYEHKGILQFRRGEIEMVNGMCLRYPDIKVEKDEKGRAKYSFSDGKKRKHLYAGLLCNNVTQGTARIIMTDGMLRVDKRFPVKGSVHDEQWALIPETTASEDSAWIKEQMIMVPKWMPGIPLNADVGYNKRYGLAKG